MRGTCAALKEWVKGNMRGELWEASLAIQIYRCGRLLLDPPKSGELSVEQDNLEEHLLKTCNDVLHHESLTGKVGHPGDASAGQSLLLGVSFARGGGSSCGKQETVQCQDPTEFPISWTRDAPRHSTCFIPSFREHGLLPQLVMSGRRQRASTFQRRKTPGA